MTLASSLRRARLVFIFIILSDTKMKHLISILLITCTTHVSICSQVRIEDYPGYPQGAEYWKEDDIMLDDGSFGSGSVTYYTNNIDDMNSPLYIGLSNGGGGFGTNYVNAYVSFAKVKEIGGVASAYMPYMEYEASYQSKHAKILRRLKHTSGVTLNMWSRPNLSKNIFAGIPALEYAYITADDLFGHRTFDEGLFRDCVNLKYVEFDIDHGSINKDAFLGCRSLEVIYFKQRPPDPNNMLKMFHSNYVSTSSWEYPNLKAIVVPDNNQSLWGGRDWNREFADKVCKAVAEGSCKIITASEFNRQRVKGISLSHSKITIKN